MLYMAAPDYLGGIMREIKFKAYLPALGQMVNIKAIDFENDFIKHEDVDWDVMRNKEIPVKKVTSLFNCVLMQYTGLHDKNGIEIYEGDIVCIWKENKVIEWDEHVAGFSWKNCQMKEYLMFRKLIAKDAEVIGNIYENPELLEAK